MENISNSIPEEDVSLSFQWLINASEIGVGKTAIIGNNRLAFYAIHYTALCVISVSLVASFVVVTKIHRKWKNAKFKLDFPIRFPLYLAIADLLWGVSHFSDHMYLVTELTFPSTLVMQVLSMNLWFFFGYQQLMHASVAGYTYLRVVHRKRLDLGQWEWKLHFVSWGFLGVTMVLFLFLNLYGCTGYWMGHDHTTVNGTVLGVIVALTSTTNAVCTTLGYYSIRQTVENMKNNLLVHKQQQIPTTSATTTPQVSSDILRKRGSRQHSVASQCLSTYVWVAACLYCPLAILLWINLFFSIFLGAVEPLSCFLIVLCANSSGWANAYGYFHNERLKKERGQDKNSKSIVTSTSSRNEKSQPSDVEEHN